MVNSDFCNVLINLNKIKYIKFEVGLITMNLIIHMPFQVLQNNIRNFPASNAQVHYNITNAEIDHPTIDEVSYIDFDPAPISSSKRPNVCKDCSK